jgi:hypothetical protein
MSFDKYVYFNWISDHENRYEFEEPCYSHIVKLTHAEPGNVTLQLRDNIGISDVALLHGYLHDEWGYELLSFANILRIRLPRLCEFTMRVSASVIKSEDDIEYIKDSIDLRANNELLEELEGYSLITSEMKKLYAETFGSVRAFRSHAIINY